MVIVADNANAITPIHIFYSISLPRIIPEYQTICNSFTLRLNGFLKMKKKQGIKNTVRNLAKAIANIMKKENNQGIEDAGFSRVVIPK